MMDGRPTRPLIPSMDWPKPMYYLNEDPTYLLAALGIAALACLVAVQVTQQGKYLYRAGGLAAAAALLFGVERFWVTDAERIEAVVHDLAGAVEASDVGRIEALLEPNVTVTRRSQTEGLVPIRTLLPLIRTVRFDFVRISHLATEAGAQTRRGSAEFKVLASGTVEQGVGDLNFGAVGSEWSLGCRETSPGVWKINRITAINLPNHAASVIRRGR